MKNTNDRCRLPPRLPGDEPWLVYTHGNSRKYKIQTFCTISYSNTNNNDVYTKSIPALRGKSICASCHGWLVLQELYNPKMFSLWNTLTSESLDLPPLPDLPISEKELSTCVLTSPPSYDIDTKTTTNCVLVLLFNDQIACWCRPTLGHNATINWVTQKLELDGEVLDDIHGSTTLNGIIYSWAYVSQSEDGKQTYLVSMKIVNEELNILSLQLKPPEYRYFCINRSWYLVESCGLLYCVGVLKRHGSKDEISIIGVWELDLIAMNWVEVKCLDGRAFFLGHDCCTWCWGSDNDNVGVQGNCVYFIRDRNVLCSYNLAEQCVTEFHTCPYPRTLTSVTWLNVKPQHQRLPSNEHSRNTRVHINEEKVEDEDDETKGRDDNSVITNLPNDVIQLISEYLHLFDYINFRTTCKKFYSIVRPLPQKKSDKLLPVPTFIIFKNDDGLCQMIDPSRDSYSWNYLQLSLDPCTVDFNKDGWLVIYSPQLDSIKLLNPFTRMKIDYPLNDDIFDLRSIGFSTNPTSSDCVTVIFDDFTDKLMLIHYFKHGNKTWNQCEFDNREYNFRPQMSSPVYFEGAFYVLDENVRLGEFKVMEDDEEESRWQVYGRPPTRCERLKSCHLVECDGDLLVVVIEFMGVSVEVYKFKFREKKWIEVKSLGKYGNYCLFVSNSSCFSLQPTEVGMRNRIYVPRLKGNSIFFYSLDTGKLHVSGRSDEDCFVDFRGTKEHVRCFWFY